MKKKNTSADSAKDNSIERDDIKGAENQNNKTRTRFFAALAMLVLALAAFGLSFTPHYGIYLLITSILLELSGLSFLSAQKKIFNFPAVKYLTITAYILLFLSGALFLGGIVFYLINYFYV